MARTEVILQVGFDASVGHQTSAPTGIRELQEAAVTDAISAVS